MSIATFFHGRLDGQGHVSLSNALEVGGFFANRYVYGQESTPRPDEIGIREGDFQILAVLRTVWVPDRLVHQLASHRHAYEGEDKVGDGRKSQQTHQLPFKIVTFTTIGMAP